MGNGLPRKTALACMHQNNIISVNYNYRQSDEWDGLSDIVIIEISRLTLMYVAAKGQRQRKFPF